MDRSGSCGMRFRGPGARGHTPIISSDRVSGASKSSHEADGSLTLRDVSYRHVTISVITSVAATACGRMT